MPILKQISDTEIMKAAYDAPEADYFEISSVSLRERKIANYFKSEGAKAVFEWGDGMCPHTGVAGDGAVFRKNCARCRQEFQKELEE